MFERNDIKNKKDIEAAYCQYQALKTNAKMPQFRNYHWTNSS